MPGRLEPLVEREPVLGDRELVVQDQQVNPAPPYPGQGLVRGGNGLDAEPDALQPEPLQAGYPGVVFQDQDGGGRVISWHAGP
jgi:hypothetical protein